MSPLLSEADTVSQDLLDILLENIIEPNKVWMSGLLGTEKNQRNFNRKWY